MGASGRRRALRLLSIVVGFPAREERRHRWLLLRRFTGSLTQPRPRRRAHQGVKRPALEQVIPAWARPTLLIDVGASADCKPEYLVPVRPDGQVYMNAIMGCPGRPRSVF